jgi:hypothetical protein
MKNSRRRTLLAAALSLVAVVGGLLVASPAQAQTVASGSFTMTGDPGDWVTGGQSYSYSTASGDTMSVSGSANSTVNMSVFGANGDWWYLDFDAPDGQTLVPGTYTGATRYPFNGSGPGLSVFGNGRGCNMLTGSFTIIDAVFGPNDYVQTFDATFEQFCDGSTAAARGDIHIANPAPPPALDLALAVATDGAASTLNGNATVHGTVTCNKSTRVTVSGTLVEVVKRELARGSFSTQVSCTPDAPVPWTATAVPFGTVPFEKGDAEATTSATGYDTDYGKYLTMSTTTVVKLGKDR